MDAYAEEILVKARERIDAPEKWCQGHFVDGERRCAEGALHWVTSENYALSGRPYANAWRYLKLACGEGIVRYNDNHTHAEVMVAFDRAIELARR